VPEPLPLLTDASTPGPPPSLLPDDGPDAGVAALLAEGVAPHDAAAEHPASSLAWAVLAEHAELADRPGSTVEAYAYARAGYHRGLDALRRAGWRGAGPVPWRHEPNRGFLRALAALRRGAAAIGEDDEVRRIDAFLRDCDAGALEEIGRHGSGAGAS
jgi:hypothetical protein